MKILSLILFLFVEANMYGQKTGLTNYIDFFQQQKEAYQAWLDSTNLSCVFAVHGIEVLREGVILNLLFKSSNPDTLSASWFAAKEDFEANNLLTLEEGLFMKMIRLFDLNSNQAVLQIKNSYRQYGEIYYLKTYTLEGRLKATQNFSRGFFDKIKVDLNLISKESNNDKLNSRMDSKNEIYNRILQFIELKYKKTKNCAEMAPNIDAFHSLNNKFLVNVSGLCREVLGEDELLFCSILKRLNLDCEAVKREDLNFEFDFDTESSKIYCQLDGKYSDDYLLFHGKVRDMDDDPAFEKLLKDHGENFLKSLKQWIEQQ